MLQPFIGFVALTDHWVDGLVDYVEFILNG